MAQPLDRQIRKHIKKLKKIAQSEIPRAASRALNKSAKKAKTTVVRGIAQQAKLPQKIIRQKVYIGLAKPKKQRARLYVYPKDVKAISLLKTATILKNVQRGTNRKGVRAGGRQFNGAFINVHRSSGRFQVFKRTSKRRYPLTVIGIQIYSIAQAEINRVSERIMRNDFPALLTHELQYRINKYKV